MAIGDKHTCKRCGKTWHQIRASKPAVCPQCKSYRWETPARVVVKETA